jgi:hypothetical protein
MSRAGRSIYGSVFGLRPCLFLPGVVLRFEGADTFGPGTYNGDNISSDTQGDKDTTSDLSSYLGSNTSCTRASEFSQGFSYTCL